MDNSLWEQLCEKVNYFIEAGITAEEPYHLVIEKELKDTFQWPSQYVKHEVSIQIGSNEEKARPDIVLEGDDFGIMIEMKSPAILLSDKHRTQLRSYMGVYNKHRNSFKCKYGLLIGNIVEIYFRNDPDKDPVLIARFRFDKNSADGNYLGRILNYHECSKEKLDTFMNDKHEIVDITSPVFTNVKEPKQQFIDPSKISENKKSILKGLKASNILLIHETGEKNPNLGFRTQNMENYFLEPNPQKYVYWVEVLPDGVRCSLTLYPRQQREEGIILKMDKLLKKLVKHIGVTSSRDNIERGTAETRVFFDYPKKGDPTHSEIIDLTKTAADSAINITNQCLEDIK